MFDLDRFIADLHASLAERSRQHMREVVARAVADPQAMLRAIGEPETAGLKILHQSPDLTIINVVWSPKFVTVPHDHRMTAAIGMYGGREDNLFWRRTPGGGKFQIEAAGGEALGVGDTALLGRDLIHSVVNPLNRLSGAIHVYDGPFMTAERSMWDPETLEEEPYDVSVVAKGMPMQPAR